MYDRKQDEIKAYMEASYSDYNLVFTQLYGEPIDGAIINNSFSELIKNNDLPKVVFHSLRQSSITYKLKLNGGDIKSVQGDSGHSQASMVTEQYSHILDADRKRNAALFEQNFYFGKNSTQQVVLPTEPIAGLELEKLSKLLADPTVGALLAALAKNIQ